MSDPKQKPRITGESWRRSIGGGFACGLAIFIAGFSLLNLLGDLFTPGFDANIWWIDFRPAGHLVGRLTLGVSSVLLLMMAIRPGMGRIRRSVTAGILGIVLLVAMSNIARFYSLLWRRELHGGVWVPFSLLVAISLSVVLWRALDRRSQDRSATHWAVCVTTLVLCAIGFPLAQMYCFGKTDYRRPADLIVVFGAKAHADGRPSDALADRVRTACALYREGYAPKLLFSGGPGDGPIDEPECMRRFAGELGVRDEDIILDRAGMNSARTVENTVPVFNRIGAKRVLAVSHFYHLPRVKMTYARAGWDVYTVPAKETYTLSAMPYLMAREVAGLWAYYLRPITGFRS